MRKPRTSVYLHFTKPDSQAVTKGFAWLRVALQALDTRHARLAIGAKADLDRGLADILDAQRIRQFKKHDELPWDGMLLQLMTLQRSATGWDGPVLALYPSARLLDAIDDIERVPAVCVISCDRVETQSWIYRWNASVLDLQNPLPAWNLPSFSNPVVNLPEPTVIKKKRPTQSRLALAARLAFLQEAFPPYEHEYTSPPSAGFLCFYTHCS